MEQQILCENKSYKSFILFKNRINVLGLPLTTIFISITLSTNLSISQLI